MTGLLVNRLTVDGHAYFLPDPVDHLKSQVLAAVRGGAAWIVVPAWRGRSAVEVLVSRGMRVAWARAWLEEPDEAPDEDVFALESLDF
jgi:hypothetical protein